MSRYCDLCHWRSQVQGIAALVELGLTSIRERERRQAAMREKNRPRRARIRHIRLWQELMWLVLTAVCYNAILYGVAYIALSHQSEWIKLAIAGIVLLAVLLLCSKQRRRVFTRVVR